MEVPPTLNAFRHRRAARPHGFLAASRMRQWQVATVACFIASISDFSGARQRPTTYAQNSHDATHQAASTMRTTRVRRMPVPVPHAGSPRTGRALSCRRRGVRMAGRLGAGVVSPLLAAPGRAGCTGQIVAVRRLGMAWTDGSGFLEARALHRGGQAAFYRAWRPTASRPLAAPSARG